MKYSGPRPACRALDGLMDEIGDPAVALIKSLGLPEAKENETLKKLEEILLKPFDPSGSTGADLRDYIYDLNRALA